MEEQLKQILKNLKLNENTISTILGGIVVIAIGAIIFNYLNKNRLPQLGQITPNAANQQLTETPTITTPKLVNENGQQVPDDLPTQYTVQKGDHLWSISKKFYNSGYNWVDIAKANNLKNASVINAGTKLTIPRVAVKAPVVADKTTSITNTSRPNAINGTSYTTLKGDHLWAIAVRAYGDGFAWTKIYDANKGIIGKHPSSLLIGLKLSIPR